MSTERLSWSKQLSHWLATPLRRHWYAQAHRASLATDGWDQTQLRRYHDARLVQVVRRAAERIPFYRRLYAEAGVDVAGFRGVEDLAKLPLITKGDLIEHGALFTQPGVPAWLTTSERTSGSSGHVATVRQFCGASERDAGCIGALWKRVGARHADRMAILRGLLPHSGPQMWEYRPAQRRLILSAYNITPQVVREYLDLMNRYRVLWLHAYPSAAWLMATHILDQELPLAATLRGVLLASETVLDWTVEVCRRAFRCPVYAHYGHREIALLAGWCEGSTEYHFLPNYGYVEFLPTPAVSGTLGEEMCELVGTRYIDQYMPLIRYRTQDFARPGDPGRCPACGRWHVRAKTLYGRAQELLVGRDGTVIPVLGLASFAYRYARRFRFQQDERGTATYSFVPADSGNVAAAVRELEVRFRELERLGLRTQVVAAADLPTVAGGKERIVSRSIPLPWEERVEPVAARPGGAAP